MNVDCDVVGGNQSTEPIFLSIERHINCEHRRLYIQPKK